MIPARVAPRSSAGCLVMDIWLGQCWLVQDYVITKYNLHCMYIGFQCKLPVHITCAHYIYMIMCSNIQKTWTRDATSHIGTSGTPPRTADTQASSHSTASGIHVSMYCIAISDNTDTQMELKILCDFFRGWSRTAASSSGHMSLPYSCSWAYSMSRMGYQVISTMKGQSSRCSTNNGIF